MSSNFLPSVRKTSPCLTTRSLKRDSGSPLHVSHNVPLEPLLMSIDSPDTRPKKTSPLALSLSSPGISMTESNATDGSPSLSVAANTSIKMNSVSTLSTVESLPVIHTCLDSANYPVLIPQYTVPIELIPFNKRRGAMAAPNDGAATAITLPPLQPAPSSPTKPLYYETCLSLFDFNKAVYGITGLTTGASPSGRDVGVSMLSTEERLSNRKLLYKNISPLEFSAPKMPRPRKLLLALDLDETLVHAFIGLKSPLPSSDALVEISTMLGSPPRKAVNAMYIKYRPHISEFMSVIAPLFEVVLFTAARPIYADTLMSVMDPKGSVIGQKSRYFRDSCTDVYNKFERSSPLPMSPKSASPKAFTTDSTADIANDTAVAAAVADEAGCEAVNGLPPLPEPGWVRVKDLAILGRPLEEIVLVDNTPTCGLLQPRNLLPVSSWFGTDGNDSGLLKVLPVLRKIAETRDVYGCLDEYCSQMQPVM